MTAPDEKPKPLAMKCRNPKCSSIQAAEIPRPRGNNKMYHCLKCNQTWTAPIGGAFRLSDV